MQTSPSLHNLAIRSRMMQACREFFAMAGFVEVETPVRIPSPAPEMHIDAPPSARAWLRTSPELHMKRLLATGASRIYQIGPCFREAERGTRHNPEFTMLEWYRASAGHLDILRDCEALIRHIVRRVTGEGTVIHYAGQRIDVGAPWAKLTMREAFTRYAQWDPIAAYDANRFDRDLEERVEPALPADRPCVLLDYPAQAAALARLKADDPSVAERWELFIGGMEIANAYGELTDATIQRARFTACNAARVKAGHAPYPLDEPFLQALETGMPPCGGIALGMDRLAMLLCNARAIDEVRSFCPPIGELY